MDVLVGEGGIFEPGHHPLGGTLLPVRRLSSEPLEDRAGELERRDGSLGDPPPGLLQRVEKSEALLLTWPSSRL